MLGKPISELPIEFASIFVDRALENRLDFEKVIRGHLVLANGEIADGYIAIIGDRISRIGSATASVPRAKESYDYRGCYIFPAAIDAQTHSRSQQGVEDFIWSTRSAAAGGIGTIVDMPYDAGRLICNAEHFNAKRTEASAQSRVDFALYGTAHPSEGAARIAEQVAAGAIGFKFSTFGTDPERFPRISPPMMHDCFAEIAKHGLFAGVHNEDDETVKQLTDKLKAQGTTGWRAHSLARPIYAENMAINLVYELGVETGCRTHIVHCSNDRGHSICQQYRQQGYPVTIETCLHYLILSEEEDVRRLGGLAKVNPPIREAKQREALWAHLSVGNITAVSTDHVSWSLERKTHENIFANASGATGLEVLVPLLVDQAVKRGMPLSRLAQVLAYNPARLFSIDHCKGALERGKDADLVVLKKSPYTYQANASGHNYADWSPYNDRKIDYRVEATMVRGNWVFDGVHVLAEPGEGRFVRPPHDEVVNAY